MCAVYTVSATPDSIKSEIKPQLSGQVRQLALESGNKSVSGEITNEIFSRYGQR